MTWIELVKHVSRRSLSDEEANEILWEHTTFPDFFGEGTPEEVCMRQLKEYFKE